MGSEREEMGPSEPPDMRRATLVIAAVSNFVTPFMSSSVNLTIPSVAAEFEIDAVTLSWIATSYLLANAVTLVPAGKLADICGRKRIFTTGVAVFSLFSLLCALANSANSLIILRFLQGVGSGMIFATSMAILTSVFPPQERGKALGITIGAAYLGLSTGPFLGGLLTQHFTWRSVYLSNIPLGLFIILLVFWKLRAEWAEARGERFDHAGSILYILGIAGMVYGVSLLPDVSSLWIAGAGLLGIVLFILWERRADHPVFPLALFTANRVFALSCLAAFFHYSATFSVTFLLSLYLQHVKALSPFEAGIVLVSQPVLMAVCSPLAGRLSDRVEPRAVASSGMVLTTGVLLFFVFLQESSTIPSVVARLVVLGVGFALFSSPNTNAIMGAVERRQYGIASGAVGTMRILGMMFSMSVVTVIFSILIGRVQITAEQHVAFMGSLKSGFAFFAVLCFAGIFASMVRGRLRPEPPRAQSRPSVVPPEGESQGDA